MDIYRDKYWLIESSLLALTLLKRSLVEVLVLFREVILSLNNKVFKGVIIGKRWNWIIAIDL
jgi:hypothetical protein